MGRLLRSTDPATGEEVGSVQEAGPSQVRDAVEAARAAQADWREVPVQERVALLARFRALLLAEADRVAELVTRESGKPLAESLMADLLPALDQARFLEKRGPALLRPRGFRLRNPLVADRTSEVHHEPLGVVGVVSPWNYPLSIPASAVLPALFAGNGVVVKPSPLTPLVAERLVSLLWQAGVPRDMLWIVHGGAATGKALVEADVDGVLFTGSVATGKAVAATCAGRLTPAMLELGGKDPMLVLDDAPLDLAVRGGVWGAFTNAGQTCASVERALVDTTLHDRFLAGVGEGARSLRLGHGLDPGTDMGPLIDDGAVKRVRQQVRQAEKAGATVEAGGAVREELGPRFWAPTVLSGIDADMAPSLAVMQEETFGPVLPVQAVPDEERAVAEANRTEFGLSASVWTGDVARGRAVARRIRAGTVTINDCIYTYGATETPWVGWGDSGLGVSHGPWGLAEVLRLRHVNVARPGRARSPWYYPYDQDLGRLLREGLPFLYGGARGKRKVAKVLAAWRRRT